MRRVEKKMGGLQKQMGALQKEVGALGSDVGALVEHAARASVRSSGLPCPGYAHRHAIQSLRSVLDLAVLVQPAVEQDVALLRLTERALAVRIVRTLRREGG